MSDWLRSTSVRLALAFAGIVCVSFLIAGALIWRTASAAAENQIRLQIELEVNAIEHELDAEGLDAAVGAISSRAERPGAFEYWVTGQSGRHMIGDIRELDGPNGWRYIDLDRDTSGAEGADDILVLTRSLPGGYRISVGADLSREQAAQHVILRTMAMIGGLAVLVCLVAGAIIARIALGRVRTLNTTLQSVSAGNLAARYPLGSTGIKTDIDSVGQGVNAMLERIEALIDNVRRVSRDVAHDLRTPLSHLGQRLELAAAEQEPVARSVAIASAQDKVDEIIRMFDATLRLAEIDAGVGKTRFAGIHLAGVAEKVADAYRLDVEASGRTLTVDRLTPGEMLGDPELVTLALANLIENAMRHTPPGSHIVVSVFIQGHRLFLAVADNGPGIPKPYRRRALEPFTRLDESRTSVGTGLGLSIVAAIARLHDAELSLSDAEPGLRVQIAFNTVAPISGDS